MRSNMTVDVAFLAGTEIIDAVQEAKKKAGEWDVAYVCFKFNGKRFSIGSTADVELVYDEYMGSSKLIVAS